MSVYEKLMAIQSELKAPKSQYNKFGGYNYRNAEDILEAVKPLCEKHKGLIYISDKPIYLEGRFYIEATANFIDVESGESIVSTASAREGEEKKGMDGSQLTGASSSYARKYALNGLLCIDDSKDADSIPPNQEETQKAPVCACCKKEIVSVTKKDGSLWPVPDMVKYSNRVFGFSLCADCMRLEKEKNDGKTH